jgi:mRNA interferase MazF
MHDNHPGLASEVVLEPDCDPIPRRSAVNLDSVESVSVAVLVDRHGRLADTRMRERSVTPENGYRI